MKLILTFIFATYMLLSMPESYSQKPLFTFGIISDVQYCDCEPEGNRFYRLSSGRLREAVNTFRTDSVNFIVNLGDLIDRGFESYKPVLDILDSSGLQVYHIKGNHDYSVDTRQKRQLPLPMPDKAGYYSFKSGNFRFIALDGNEVSTYAATSKASIKTAESYLSQLKDSGSVNAISWNGGISSRQLAWLEVQLNEAAAGKEKVFVLCHFPLYPENIHNLLNYKDVNSLLSNYQNIIACFAGHNHAGNYGNFNMIHFVTFRGMVDSSNKNSFAIVEVYANKIWIKGAGREKSQILAY
jgi:predicted MPP superfamily phosphohydrolase